jgi:hypothetical protein
MNAPLNSAATALQTFEIRPSSAILSKRQAVDELMLDWGSFPPGSFASIYLPLVSADDILALASQMYVSHPFSRVDDHTLSCSAGGVTYLPVPSGGQQNYAGLLSIAVPTIRPGAVHTLTVRQVTGGTSSDADAMARAPQTIARRVLGTFQISVSGKTHKQVLFGLERLYAVMLWIAEAIPSNNRWSPVFQRYLGQLAGQISRLGGKPNQIKPSPNGEVPGLPAPTQKCSLAHEHLREIFGKIEAIIYDHFGDFEGFVLETETGAHHRFRSREPAMLDLVRRAWLERTRVAVVPEAHQADVARSVMLWI